MGKISPVSGKYIVRATIHIDGNVDRPDIIGAIFGQTEGLLGSDLELRELQRSGRIGRIEVNSNAKNGKTQGDIIIPSSMDKAETAIIAAALEVIERIGPCNATIRVKSIEDIRISKRNQITNRAKELLKHLVDSVMPDSQELADDVASSVRVMEIESWGPEKLAAGPGVEQDDEIILVEGRADVLTLLKNGFKNAVAMNGTSLPKSLIPLCKEKTVTLFVDGDRGGNLIIKDVTSQANIDFIAKAPDGKEVEELAKKEIHQAIRSKLPAEQAKAEATSARPTRTTKRTRDDKREPREAREPRTAPKIKLQAAQKKSLSDMLDNLVGTHGAFVLDESFNILGKVPKAELESTIKGVGQGIFAVVVDGNLDKDMLNIAETNNISCLVGMESQVKSSRLSILTPELLAQ